MDLPLNASIRCGMATMTVIEPPGSQIALLHRISSIVSSELSLDEMLGEIVGLTAQVTGCDACLVYLLDRDTDEIVLRASQVSHAAALGNLRMKMGEGVTGWVAEHKSVVALSSNAAADARFKLLPALNWFTPISQAACARISGCFSLTSWDNISRFGFGPCICNRFKA